jgi:hypothetical protein
MVFLIVIARAHYPMVHLRDEPYAPRQKVLIADSGGHRHVSVASICKYFIFLRPRETIRGTALAPR